MNNESQLEQLSTVADELEETHSQLLCVSIALESLALSKEQRDFLGAFLDDAETAHTGPGE